MQLQNHIKFNSIILAVLMVWVAIPLQTIGQTSVSIDDYAICRHTESLIPITVKNFTDVAALTIYISVDTTQIEFLGLENINDVFSDGDFISNIDGQELTLTWFSLNSANLQNGLMCDIHVVLKEEAADLIFIDGCELANSSLAVINNVEYSSGTVLDLSSYSIYPISQSLTEGDLATLSVVDLPENVICQWQAMFSGGWEDLNDDLIYNGVNTSQLSILSVSMDLNNTLYRCITMVNGCEIVTSSSELLVAPNALNEILISDAVVIYPVPFADQFTCLFNSSLSEFELKLTDMSGKVILSRFIENIISGQQVVFNNTTMPKGTYLLILNRDGRTLLTKKLFHQ